MQNVIKHNSKQVIVQVYFNSMVTSKALANIYWIKWTLTHQVVSTLEACNISKKKIGKNRKLEEKTQRSKEYRNITRLWK